MKKFSEMDLKELEQVVNRSKTLRDKLERYIDDCEMGWCIDKLNCVKNSLSDWCVGAYNPSYIHVSDWYRFLDGVIKCSKIFGCSTRVEKKIAQVEKLRYSNLFEYHCNILKEMWEEEEIYSITKWIEECGFELYCGKVGEKTRDYLDCFFDNYGLDDYLYDESTETFYKPTKLDVA